MTAGELYISPALFGPAISQRRQERPTAGAGEVFSNVTEVAAVIVTVSESVVAVDTFNVLTLAISCVALPTRYWNGGSDANVAPVSPLMVHVHVITVDGAVEGFAMLKDATEAAAPAFQLLPVGVIVSGVTAAALHANVALPLNPHIDSGVVSVTVFIAPLATVAVRSVDSVNCLSGLTIMLKFGGSDSRV